tara:strand:+ start:845 stop:1186 length:342 start_codon:yes stop_codon:yes gene_type:complete
MPIRPGYRRRPPEINLNTIHDNLTNSSFFGRVYRAFKFGGLKIIIPIIVTVGISIDPVRTFLINSLGKMGYRILVLSLVSYVVINISYNYAISKYYWEDAERAYATAYGIRRR